MARTHRVIASETYGRILLETGCVKVEPVPQIAEREPVFLPELHSVDGYTYADFEACNADSVIAVVASRPLFVVLEGKRVGPIPEGWVRRARADLGVCPKCAMRSPDVKRGCDHR